MEGLMSKEKGNSFLVLTSKISENPRQDTLDYLIIII